MRAKRGESFKWTALQIRQRLPSVPGDRTGDSMNITAGRLAELLMPIKDRIDGHGAYRLGGCAIHPETVCGSISGVLDQADLAAMEIVRRLNKLGWCCDINSESVLFKKYPGPMQDDKLYCSHPIEALAPFYASVKEQA